MNVKCVVPFHADKVSRSDQGSTSNGVVFTKSCYEDCVDCQQRQGSYPTDINERAKPISVQDLGQSKTATRRVGVSIIQGELGRIQLNKDYSGDHMLKEELYFIVYRLCNTNAD